MGRRPDKKNRPSGVAWAALAAFPMIKNKLLLLQVVAIAVSGLWVYWPALHGDWIWDDPLLVSRNPLVHDPAGLWKIWFEPGRLMDYFPLKVTVEWLEWQLWQNDTFGYHLLNVILHIISSLLIWRLLSKLGLRFAWLGGLIFAIHPVTVESVAWISELKNTLSLPPFLWAMCVLIDYDEQGNPKDYFLALGLFLVAMLCKTTVVMLPMVILLYAWWKRGRVDWNDLKVSAPFFAISITLGLTTIWFLHHHAIGEGGIAIGGFLSRLALAGLSISFYFSKCILPVGLVAIYPRWIIDPPSLIQFLPWPILGGVIWWLWTKRASWGRHALLGLGFFLINLVPFIGFTAGSYMDFTWVMDHFLYIPLIGLIGLAVAGMGQVSKKLPHSSRSFSIGIVTVILALLAWGSHAYAGIFLGEETFWAYTIQHNPNAWPAYHDLGVTLFRANRFSEAVEQYELSLKIKPDNAEVRNNLGLALSQVNRVPEAIEQYKWALRINPKYVPAYTNLGYILDQIGQRSEAMEEYDQALKIKPDDALTHNDMGNALSLDGKMAEAIEQYGLALKSDPDYAEAQANLGLALLRTGQLVEAIKYLELAIKNKPDYAEVYNNLGFALMRQGHPSEAIEQFEKAIKNNPDYVQAHNNLGGVLAQTGRVAEAIEQYNISLKINPNDANARDHLARLQGQGLQPTAPAVAPSGK